MELERILNSRTPADCLTGHMVHQDGTCNGLQHYAAMARDLRGGIAVNLLDCESPMDVYAEVLKIAAQRVHKDASRGHRYAIILDDKVSRSVIKQTVMTSVYGVTLVGAKEQIKKRLLEIPELDFGEHSDENLGKGALYLAEVTFEAISILFSSATAVMGWLGDVTALVAAAESASLSWITPLGLPVSQPYTQEKPFEIESLLATVNIGRSQKKSVDRIRQMTAAPPNFVHSVDSAHMLRTAGECKQRGIPFAAVHDSFWTHPAYVDNMNSILRESFVEIHRIPLALDLEMQLKQKYPHLSHLVPPVPEIGDYDIGDIRRARYFFN